MSIVTHGTLFDTRLRREAHTSNQSRQGFVGNGGVGGQLPAPLALGGGRGIWMGCFGCERWAPEYSSAITCRMNSTEEFKQVFFCSLSLYPTPPPKKERKKISLRGNPWLGNISHKILPKHLCLTLIPPCICLGERIMQDHNRRRRWLFSSSHRRLGPLSVIFYGCWDSNVL